MDMASAAAAAQHQAAFVQAAVQAKQRVAASGGFPINFYSTHPTTGANGNVNGTGGHGAAVGGGGSGGGGAPGEMNLSSFTGLDGCFYPVPVGL